MLSPRNTDRKFGKTLLHVSSVFDTYWRFASARQQVFLRRIVREEPPWTDDSILARYRFTNVFRASDRVSQYLIKHVIYEGDQSADEVVFRTLLYKVFNRIDTWELLRSAIGGQISWKQFDLRR